VAVTSASPACY